MRKNNVVASLETPLISTGEEGNEVVSHPLLSDSSKQRTLKNNNKNNKRQQEKQRIKKGGLLFSSRSVYDDDDDDDEEVVVEFGLENRNPENEGYSHIRELVPMKSFPQQPQRNQNRKQKSIHSSELARKPMFSVGELLPSLSSIHFFFFFLLWNFAFASFAACLSFWVPEYSIWDVNITALVKNVLGSLIIGVCCAFQQVKFQYYQTYIMYDAISGGFCSVFTSFGNFIEEIDVLFSLEYGLIKSLINIVGTLSLSFLAYQFGRILALKWKAGTNFSLDLLIMENEDKRMEFEVSRQLQQRERDEFYTRAPLLSSDSEILVPDITKSGNLNVPFKTKVNNYYTSSSPMDDDQQNLPTGSIEKSVNTADQKGVKRMSTLIASDVKKRSSSSFFLPIVQPDMSPMDDDKFGKLERHVLEQLNKRDRHRSKALQGRHIIILTFLFTVVFFSIIIGYLVQYFKLTSFPSGVSKSNYEIFMFELGVCIFWSVFGCFMGRFLGKIGSVGTKKTVQWSTFRVNFISCLLIGTAHNVLLLRQYFPYGTTAYFGTVVKRFIGDFCGSESSYAGFINETVSLWNSKMVPKIVALKNFFYNMLLCQILFLIVVYSIRFTFYYDNKLYV